MQKFQGNLSRFSSLVVRPFKQDFKDIHANIISVQVDDLHHIYCSVDFTILGYCQSLLKNVQTHFGGYMMKINDEI